MNCMDQVRLNTSAAWGLPVVVAKGTRVLLRPIMPGDRAKLHWGMRHLSADARRHRFFSALADLDDELADYLTEIDYRSHFAWVAVALDVVGQPVVAVGRYVRLPSDPSAAEIAFVVGDDYRRQGLASALLDLLAIVARHNGIRRFHARVMTDNVAMRSLLSKAGARMELDDAGILRTTMDVPAPSGRSDPDTALSLAEAAASQVRHTA
jgi:RimJ/RimL family protein N-acetyltransferase